MQSKLAITNKDIVQFSIDVVDRYEGCSEASVYLKKIYGDKIMNLSKVRSDFEMLIRRNKEPWVINFLLNTIKKEFRIEFMLKLIKDNIKIFQEDAEKIKVLGLLDLTISNLKNPSGPSLDSKEDLLIYLSLKREEIKRQIQGIGAQVAQVNQDHFKSLQAESQYLKGFIIFLNSLNGTVTRDSVKVISSLAEATQWYMSSGDGINYHKQYFESTATSLIDYTGLFVVSTEKDHQK